MFINEIEVLLRYAQDKMPHPKEITDDDTIEITRFFEKEGLIEAVVGGKLTTTDKGDAYIALLCSVKLPRQKWCNEHGDVIKYQRFEIEKKGGS